MKIGLLITFTLFASIVFGDSNIEEAQLAAL
jgi:hypothetical protein